MAHQMNGMLEDTYIKAKSKRPKGVYRQISEAMKIEETKAIKLANNLHLFSYEEFERKYKGKIGKNELFDIYDEYIENLRNEARIGTAESYELSKKSFKQYRPNLKFKDIRPETLASYEKYMIEIQKRSLTTVGIYARALRAIINIGMTRGLINEYPFYKAGNSQGYKIPVGKNIKKALTLQEIQKLFDYKPTNKTEQFYLDLWLFSYLCNGVNFKDIAKLRNQDIDDEDIIFIREKTKRTSRGNLKPIRAFVTKEISTILKRHQLKSNSPSDKVFPIIDPAMSPVDEHKKIKQLIKQVNKYIKQISAKVGIEKHVTTYTARHSFATILKNSGTNDRYISEALGHSNIISTENYLDDFNIKERQKQSEKLTAFEGTNHLKKLSKNELLEKLEDLIKSQL